MLALPPRYEAKWLLGQGGGGEVWAVRDRVNGKMLAFKVLASGAGESEVMALVREAMALSGLEGLGVPCEARYYPGGIHAFHALVWDPAARRCWRDALAFLDRHLRTPGGVASGLPQD